jgi:prepilin-type N-terminal cleavage/methylation domain-containing protein
MKKGFTLIELIIVIVIVGILAAVALTQYTKVVEKGRGAEARIVLGTLRTAQNTRFMEMGSYSSSLSILGVIVPNGACQSSHYFRYTCMGIGLNAGTCTAYRCTAGTPGKYPDYDIAYTKALTAAGNFSGTPGY